MVCVTYARVQSVDINSFCLRDLLSGTEIQARARGEAVFGIQEGDEGLFQGLLIAGGIFEVHKLDRRKMLTPMYEKDLFGASGKFTLIEPMNDPFTEFYKLYLETPYKDTHAEELIERESQPNADATPAIVAED